MKAAVVRLLAFCVGLSLTALAVAGEPAANSKAPPSGKSFPVVTGADDSPLPAKADKGGDRAASKPARVVKLDGADDPKAGAGGAKGAEDLLKDGGVKYDKDDKGNLSVSQEVDGQQVLINVQNLDKTDLAGRKAVWLWVQLTPNKEKGYKLPDAEAKRLVGLCDPAGDKDNFGVQFGNLSVAPVLDDKMNPVGGEVAYLNYYIPAANADGALVKDYVNLCGRKAAKVLKEIGGTEKSRGLPRRR